jgi:hypothetical protein
MIALTFSFAASLAEKQFFRHTFAIVTSPRNFRGCTIFTPRCGIPGRRFVRKRNRLFQFGPRIKVEKDQRIAVDGRLCEF